MLIADLKTKLGITQFQLSYLTDENGDRQIDPKTTEPTKWLKHWDNDTRTAVLMHEDTVKLAQAKPEEFATLGMKPSVEKTGAQGKYNMVVVVNYTEPDMVL